MISVHPAISSVLGSTSRNRHRQLIVLSGSQSTCVEMATNLINCEQLSTNPAWLGNLAPERIRRLQRLAVRNELGNEFSSLVINAFAGFDCDAFAALTGTITAGGALILLTPSLNHWHQFNDPEQTRVLAYAVDPPARENLFLQRFAQMTNLTTELVSESTPVEIRYLKDTGSGSPLDPQPENSSEQERLINEIAALPNDKTANVMLITADRGRGKSAALGMAAATIIRQTDSDILVTAPSRRAAKILFQHFEANVTQTTCTRHSQLRVKFISPDQLTYQQPEDKILLVDEAASIPLPMLLSYAQAFSTVVYATTVQGYEGAGRGFAIRFKGLLEQHGITVREQKLHQPFRWSHNDPLERFCNHAMMLDADIPSIVTTDTSIRATKNIAEILPSELYHNEHLLRSIFGLLVQAHYRTSPLDLKHMLDGNNLRTFILQQDEMVIGACLIAIEGPLVDIELRQGVLQKRRRPNGHLLPQLLCQYSLSMQALDLCIGRVVRIAIHPQLQRKGLGGWFLTQIEELLQSSNLDGIGAMFGAVPDTVRFWVSNGYQPWHIGTRKQTSSGYRSISVLKPLSSHCLPALERARALYQDGLYSIDTEQPNANRAYYPIDGDYSTQAMKEIKIGAELLDPFVIKQYCSGARSFNDSRVAIARTIAATQQSVQEPARLSDSEIQLLTLCRSPTITVAELRAKLQINNHNLSKKEIEKALRQLLLKLTNVLQ